MRESTSIVLLCVIILVVGAGAIYFETFYGDFTFHKSSISTSGLNVSEVVIFQPNKAYHTLYRNFEDPEFINGEGSGNHIGIITTVCEVGQAYVKDFNSNCYDIGKEAVPTICKPYTERNEYGCTFGDKLGFVKGKDYMLGATFELHPTNLFEVDGRNYLKFVAYSRGMHGYLNENNFILSEGIIREKRYYPNEYVIVYIPYDGETEGYNVVALNDFEFDGSGLGLRVLLALLPALLVFGSWFYFGREKSFQDVPEQVSFYPNTRKAWQVAAFFNPPFGNTDEKFISTLLIDFYHRKVIDIKEKGKDLYIKLNSPKNFDEVETQFFQILKYVKEKTDKKYFDGEYFNLKKSFSSLSLVSTSTSLKFHKLQATVSKESKKYFSRSGDILLFGGMFLVTVIGFITQSFAAVFTSIFLMFVLFIVTRSSALFLSFEKENHKEFQHWQAFKKYLSRSFTIKSGTHKTVKMWDQFLVYATALGVSKKVIKELKAANILDEKEYRIYTGIPIMSHSFGVSSGASGSGGGFGGAGGGGVGGGGGGGR